MACNDMLSLKMIDSPVCALQRYDFSEPELHYYSLPFFSAAYHSIQKIRNEPYDSTCAVSAYSRFSIDRLVEICPFCWKIVPSLRMRHRQISTQSVKRRNGIEIAQVGNYILFQEKSSREKILLKNTCIQYCSLTIASYVIYNLAINEGKQIFLSISFSIGIVNRL